ncbi:hypothetical protein B4U80_09127 [Leptotrombidium deliense]|uniref:G-protein coupled receptors family 1 profile domain-containing protein n=1 Tax=Leptotrombidium deliense TaxID=299467 RepID=A0A443SQ11_9ACAR|nr:hypothetical protein B4U80_09127 [Leptotrombidium deliense]
MVYLISWLPYLTFSLPDGKWPLVNAKEHCIIQQSVTGQVTTVLLTLLAIRKLYDCLNRRAARIISLAVVIAWIIPQLIYLSISEVSDSDKSSFQFLDKLLLIPRSNSENNNQLTIGFMLCIHRLESPVVAQLSWHYIILVVPLTALILFSFIVQAFRSKAPENECKCPPDLLVSLCLYFNLMWLLILRPLIVLQTLVVNKGLQEQSPTYLDFGAHLVIIFSSVFVPFASNGGLRGKRMKNVDTNESGDSIDCNSHDFIVKDRY